MKTFAKCKPDMKRKGTKERKTAGDAYLIYDRELWVALKVVCIVLS